MVIYYVQTICWIAQPWDGTATCCWVDKGCPGPKIYSAGHWLQEQLQVHGSGAEDCWLATVTCCWAGTVVVVGNRPEIWGGGVVVSVIATDVATLEVEMNDV